MLPPAPAALPHMPCGGLAEPPRELPRDGVPLTDGDFDLARPSGRSPKCCPLGDFGDLGGSPARVCTLPWLLLLAAGLLDRARSPRDGDSDATKRVVDDALPLLRGVLLMTGDGSPSEEERLRVGLTLLEGTGAAAGEAILAGSDCVLLSPRAGVVRVPFAVAAEAERRSEAATIVGWLSRSDLRLSVARGEWERELRAEDAMLADLSTALRDEGDARLCARDAREATLGDRMME